MAANIYHTPIDVEPYSVLAAGYDVVMEHVEYEAWAAYVDTLIRRFNPEAQHVLELGCGTGSMALCLQPRGSYHYRATDRSETMVRVARRKADHMEVPVSFSVADFTDFKVQTLADIALLLYDGLNYLLQEEQVQRLFESTYKAVETGGLFIFDQSTPANSLNNGAHFEDEGTVDGFHYVRHSSYDSVTRQHTTSFSLTVSGKTYRETHVQRAYSLEEIRSLLEKTPFVVEACYDGMTDAPATASTERAHWVLRKPYNRS